MAPNDVPFEAERKGLPFATMPRPVPAPPLTSAQRQQAAEREAMVLARIDATIRRSPLSAPLWLEVTVDRNSRLSRAVYVVGVWLLIATAAALAGSLLGKAAANNAETLRQIEDGRVAW